MTMPDQFTRFDLAAAERAARFFDMDYVDYRDDIPTLKAFARRTGGPLLELGCGTGRVAIPLAEAGFHVTGVDQSPVMLSLARSRAAASPRLSPRAVSGSPVPARQSLAGTDEVSQVANPKSEPRTPKASSRLTFIEGDFATVPLAGSFHFAFTVMNTFLHLLTRDEQMQALHHWRDHLAPGGLLLIDVFAPDIDELAGLDGRAVLDKTWREPESGATMMKWVARTVDPAEQILHVTFLYDVVAADGSLQRTVVPFDLRYLWRFEAEWLLEAAGFEMEGLYGDWELTPFDSGSERMILVAGKRGE